MGRSILFRLVSTPWLVALLYGCSSGDEPAAQWSLAAQGLYTGEISANAEFTLIGSLNHGASLWRNSDNERLFNWSHQQGEFAELVAAGFSADGTRAVTTDPRTLVLWNTQSGQALNYWTTPGAVLDVALLADGQRVLMGLEDHSAVLFDAASGDYLATLLHEAPVGSVAASADMRLLLTGSDDNAARLWQLPSGEQVQLLQHDNPVRVTALSASGRWAFTAAQSELVGIWQTQDGALVHELYNGINHGVTSAEFSNDERLLAVGYANRFVDVYDVATGKRLRRWDPGKRDVFRATGAAILEVTFSPTNTLLYALSGDGRLLKLSLS